MIDAKKTIQNVIEVWSKLAQKRLRDEQIENVVNHVKSKLIQKRPTLSLYGAYNAGKSTLLNALIGEERASMGDTPETFKVTEYTWGSWTIYDTPGIDAPIKHENETNEHIAKSECILFAVSTDGDLNTELLYEKLVDLARRKKPIFIVINDKSGYLSSDNPEDLANIFVTIKINIDRAWMNNKLMEEASKPKYAVINSKSALKGRLENKQMLIQKSGILALEEQIDDILRCSGEEDIINGLIDFFEKPFENLADTISLELNNPALHELMKHKRKLEFEKMQIENESEKIIRNGLKDVIALLNSFDVQNGNKDELDNQINTQLEPIKHGIRDYLDEKLTKLAEKFEAELISLSIGNFTQKVTDGLPANTVKDNVMEKMALDKIKDIGKDSAEAFTKEGLKKLFLKMREFKFPPFKGRWEATFDKWAGKFAGPIIKIATLGIEFYMVHRQHAEYERMLESQQLAIQTMVDRVKNDVYFALIAEIKSAINQFFEELFDEINESAKQLCNDSKMAEIDLDKLAEIQRNLRCLASNR